jgi:plastocyanin
MLRRAAEYPSAKADGGEQMWKSTIRAALLVASTAAACSSDDTQSNGAGESQAAGGEQGCESPVETAKITIADLAFHPDCFELPPGTSTLAVQNTDDVDHTFTMDEVELNEGIDPGETAAVDVSAINDGVWPFHCSIHPQMTGFLTVH